MGRRAVGQPRVRSGALTLEVLGISGSLRRGSYNTMLLRAAAAALPAGVHFEEWRGLAYLPPYDEDLDSRHAPPAVASLRRTIARTDAILISTPEYNSSIPGTLKNALDWASRPFPENCLRGKPVAVVGASTGLFGAVWAQAELRKVLKAVGADVLDYELSLPSAQHAFASEGRLSRPDLAHDLRAVVQALVARAVGRPSTQAPARRTADSRRVGHSQG